VILRNKLIILNPTNIIIFATKFLSQNFWKSTIESPVEYIIIKVKKGKKEKKNVPIKIQTMYHKA